MKITILLTLITLFSCQAVYETVYPAQKEKRLWQEEQRRFEFARDSLKIIREAEMKPIITKLIDGSDITYNSNMKSAEYQNNSNNTFKLSNKGFLNISLWNESLKDYMLSIDILYRDRILQILSWSYLRYDKLENEYIIKSVTQTESYVGVEGIIKGNEAYFDFNIVLTVPEHFYITKFKVCADDFKSEENTSFWERSTVIKSLYMKCIFPIIFFFSSRRPFPKIIIQAY